MKILRLALLGIFLSTPALSAPTYIPVMNGQFFTGQWYFEGEKSALGGNAGMTFVPAVRFSNRFSVIPTVETNYRGTRSAEELAGGSTLFQDTWENGVGVKAVHGLNERWNVRERAGYRIKWFRETTNENWNDGLYDYRLLTVGGELERHWGKKASIAGGYDLSLLRFPNYTSLESSQSGDLAREFSGTDVLDQTIQMFTLRTRFPLIWQVTSSVDAILSPRAYDDQHIVQLNGLLTAEKREDTLSGGSLSVQRIFDTPKNSKLAAGLNYGFTTLDSNQNHYDARATQFIGDFYDYDQQSYAAQFTLAFGRNASGPMTIDSGYSYSRREYGDRPVQSETGTYGSDKLYVSESTVNLGFGYPLTKNFRLRTTASFGKSKSNNAYEALYRYNYSNSNYLFGVTYEY